ncbi:CHAT domain-containing protein [Suillus placidus]|uniref:CHAT domain-containing protein n=1 Tax=Suillus placidus TaxID=48579 RepID=A0A9P6ZQ83_9AGAM|nr:CHAT domain-containing protein [Suillus placidus]
MLPLSPNQLADLAEQCLRRDDPHALDKVISLHYDALGYYNAMHACRGQLLCNLGTMLHTRSERQGNNQDLDEAIPLLRESVALHPGGHPNRFMSLSNLANGLSARFGHRSNVQDLDEAIVLQREALALVPVGHTHQYMSLNNLATTLSTRFQHRDNRQDLADAITLYREALDLLPVGHPNRFVLLNNLAKRLSARFDRQGDDQDLDDAIALHREALALCPVGHPHRSRPLNDLAKQLFARFDRRNNNEDLDDAIALHREALALRPVGHPHRSKPLNDLANQLSTRFHCRSNDQDLDDAIALHREALALCPVGHQERVTSLTNLANALSTRFKHRGNDENLDDAIALNREALALHPVGHPHRPISLQSLATTLSTCFEHRHNGQDLQESLENLRCALTLMTQHDPRQLIVHTSLATVYLLFHQSGLDGTGEDTDSLNAAMHHLKAAANVVSAGLLPRLQASLSWVRHVRQHSHGTELEAYVTSMQLLDAYMSAMASVSSRHNAMKDIFPSILAVEAASCALRSGDTCRAVELLEQGRTIIWTQMTRLRTPLDSFQTCGDHAVILMKRFRELSSLIDKPPASHPEGTPGVDVEAEETKYRRLVEDWNRAVEEIRKIKGFSRFLLPPLFSDLQDAARDGPIIVLIASKSSCNAIIIPHKQPPTSIQLPTDWGKLLKLVLRFREAVQKQAGPKRTKPELIKALRELWCDVVRPVVDNLDGFACRGSRIWWCPTWLFSFLPLHAAGEYRQHGPSLSQLYVSSYTPSLTALMRARRSYDRSLSVHFAAVGQNRPSSASSTLDCVEPELELVRSLLPPPPTVSFTKITSIDATKSGALCALRDNTWLHFACHGTQNFEEPFRSAFLMRDQPLSLLDITQMNLSRHEFAFLSACETAVGDFHTPDEVVHLAAGLQFAGVKSVIGTLWRVDDSTVQRLVDAFYTYLCGDGTMNSKRAARALHRAVQSLACDKDMPLDQRIVFMHIGI